MTKLLPRCRYDETSIVGPSIDHTNFRLTFLNVECWACAWKLRNGVYEALRDTFSGALLAWSGSKRKFTFGWSGFMCLCFCGWKLIVARYHKIFFGMLSACAILLKATMKSMEYWAGIRAKKKSQIDFVVKSPSCVKRDFSWRGRRAVARWIWVSMMIIQCCWSISLAKLARGKACN